MTITIGIALFVCIIGGAVHVITKSPQWAELGRLAFGIGLFVALAGAGQVAALLGQ